MTRIELTSLGISFAVLLAGARADAAIHVNLRERIVATASVVRLGNVAEIVAADRARARQLAALPLMPAPAPGTEQYLRKREVEDLLAAHGENLHELRFEGAPQVAIFTPASNSSGRSKDVANNFNDDEPMNRHAAILAGYTEPIGPSSLDDSTATKIREELNRAIVDYLSKKTGRDHTGCVAYDVAERHLAQLHDATSPLVCQGGREPWTGRQRLIVSFTTPRGPVQIPIYANLRPASGQVVVAVQPIARGEVITAADIELHTLESVPAATSRRAPVDSIEELIGMEARQAIQAGDTIFTDQVQAPVIVKRGEVIAVRSQGGGIRVRTSARALKDAANGELVQVESLETREKYDVRVVGPREAVVFAASRPARDESNTRPTETARRLIIDARVENGTSRAFH
jgi:flagella basal body P-ring formation protein FlgA